MMKLPTQARPVARKVSTAKTPSGSIVPNEWIDGVPIGLIVPEPCEKECFRKCSPIALNCMAREGDCGFSECLTNCKSIKCP